MNVTVNSQQLATELRLLNKVVPTKPAIAILSHVLLMAEQTLILRATDLEVSLTTPCEARVDEPGAVTLPAAKLLALVEQFPDADISIKTEKGRVTVRCGQFTSSLHSLGGDQFPRLPEAEGTAVPIDAETFRRLVSRTRYAINAANSKYALRGALLMLKGPAVGMVATDARRLALATAMRNGGPDHRVILPVKVLDVLSAQTDGGDVELVLGGQHLFFTLGGRTFSSRTIDGEFPGYEKIIPAANDKAVTVDKHQLISAMRRVLVTAESNGATWLALRGDGTMHLAAASAEVGTGDEAVPVQYDGPPLKVCVNGEFLLDFLNAALRSQVTIKLKDASTAALLMDGDDSYAVVMLMRG